MKANRLPKSARENWKNYERWVAHYTGGRRNPVNGRGDEADVEHPVLAIECKYGQRAMPAWYTLGQIQAFFAAIHGQKLPVVWYEQAGQPYEDSTVCMKARHYRQLLILAGIVTEDPALHLPPQE